MKRKAKISVGETRVAGEGADGALYGVTTVTSKGRGPGGHRKQVCATCPWRKDAQVGRFPAQAYRESANTAYDASFNMFSCHESGLETPQTCAGFLIANSANNVAVRIAISRGDLNLMKVKNDVPLYDSYRDMAVANGVPEDDGDIAPCRGDREAYETVASRLRRTQFKR